MDWTAQRSLFAACFVLFGYSASVSAHLDDPGVSDDPFLEYALPDGNEDDFLDSVEALGCKRANSDQMSQVGSGNSKAKAFFSECLRLGGSSKWCSQIMRPNPESKSIFQCTYGADQVHQLIHPDETTWPHAFKAVKLVSELEAKGIRPCLIYNWWRPEPYNANVGGAAGRHPFGTSVDVRFCSMADMEKAFKQLCQWRKQGRLRAVGYYGSTGLHLGIGDRSGNTWGKSCD